MTLTVIIPVYNEADTIQLLIDRVRNTKTLCMGSVIQKEIIVVDDGSSDLSLKIIGDLLDQWQYNSRSKNLLVKLVKHGENRGCYAARNTGLDEAKGDLIGFQDADDISLDFRVEDQVNALFLLASNYLIHLVRL